MRVGIFYLSYFCEQSDITWDIFPAITIGRRLCAGETFARNSIFLFLTALLQNFTVRAPDNQTIPNLKNASSGIFTSSPNFWLKFEAR